MRPKVAIFLSLCAVAGGLAHSVATEAQQSALISDQRHAVWPPSTITPKTAQPAASLRVIAQQPPGVPPVAFQSGDRPPRAPEPIRLGDAIHAPAISLEELQAVALANNPTLVQAAAQVSAARGRWLQAGLYPNPSIGYMADEIGMAGTAGMQGIAVSQQIVRGNKLGLDRAAASQEIARAQQQLESQRLRVLNDVRLQFYNVAVAERTMQQNNELVQLAEQGLKIANDLLAGLQVSRIDVLQARVELSTTRVAAELARNRYVAVWRRLAATLGTPEIEPVQVAADLEALPQLTWAESLARVLGASPELAAARADIARASWAVRRARAEPIPDVNFMAGVQHDNEGGDDVASLQIMVPVPIHDKNQGAIRAAVAELRRAQAEVARLELQLQSRLAAAFERYANAREQVERYSRDILPDARQSLELVTRGYREGEFAYLPLLESQRSVSRANLAYLSALEQLWESATAIEGMLLLDSLEASPR